MEEGIREVIELSKKFAQKLLTTDPRVMQQIITKLISLRTTAVGWYVELNKKRDALQKRLMEAKADILKEQPKIKKTDLDRKLLVEHLELMQEINKCDSLAKDLHEVIANLDLQIKACHHLLKALLEDKL